MTFHYNLTGADRKRLVNTMAEILECRPRYLGMPSAAYEVDVYSVSKNGDVTCDDRTDSDEVEMLVEALLERGFEPEAITKPETASSEDDGEPEGTEEETDEAVSDASLTISLPLDGFDAGGLNRLHDLIASKRTLLCKALGVELLPVQVTEDRVNFPWFRGEIDADHVKAYTELISRICAMAKNSRRVTAKDKPTDNDKYAFRCFLLRLGFIGEEFKAERRILLSRLNGSSAFRQPREADTAVIPTEENTVKVDVDEALERLKDPAVQAEVRAILNGEDAENEDAE